MTPARSLLFVPANRQKMLDKAMALPADAFIIDLEDSVPASEKPEARFAAREYVERLPADRGWIRINSTDSTFIDDDLSSTIGAKGLAGFMLPKAESPEQLAALDRKLNELETKAGVKLGSTELILTLESARAVLFSHSLSTCTPRVVSLVFGGARDADLMNDMGCSWSSDGPELMYARQHALLSMRAGGIACPLDGVFADVRDKAAFDFDTTLSRRLGYRGRAVVHPDQVEAANRLYSPSAAEIDYYSRVLEALEHAHARGEASTTVDGRMIDEAMGITARRVIEQAKDLS